MVDGSHPELDTTKVLDGKEHQQYQMLIGMLNWIVTFGRLDIAYAIKSLAQVRFDLKDPDVIKNRAEGHLEIDLSKKLKEHYLDAQEVINDSVPAPLLDELTNTAYDNSDYAHNK
eukprot:9713670-Ditylum_brightwellii.AAC.1